MDILTHAVSLQSLVSKLIDVVSGVLPRATFFTAVIPPVQLGTFLHFGGHTVYGFAADSNLAAVIPFRSNRVVLELQL